MSSKATAMAFFNINGLVPAWNWASKFAGEDGRVGTMPDVIKARALQPYRETAWQRYFTTATAEYLGMSKGGNKILIVAHGIGPMATIDGILAAYAWEFKDKSRNNRGGRISLEEFHKLESGHYGAVHVIDYAALVARHPDPYAFRGIHNPFNYLSESQVIEEPLMRARLGPDYYAYAKKHAGFAREFYAEHHDVDAKKWAVDPIIAKMDDASNCSYPYREVEDGMAFAHLLSIGTLNRVCHSGRDRLETLSCDVSCHEWGNGVRLLGVRKDALLNNIHKGPDPDKIVKRSWRKLLRPVQPTEIGLRMLMQMEDKTPFTQYPKIGERMDGFDPEYRIISMECVGEPVEFKTTIGGYHGFFKYGLKEVEAIAPQGANVYDFVSDPQIVWQGGNPEFHVAMVQFYKAKIDMTKRLPKADEVANDFDALMALL